jgi:hypothetical protein
LLAEGTIVIDDVHLYAAPIPSTFFSSGGSRRLSVALATIRLFARPGPTI